jgi:two-component system cell cycle response regulator
MIERSYLSPPPPHHAGNPIRVLLVTDATEVKPLEKFVKKKIELPVHVICATSIAHALDELRKTRFDALLLDLLVSDCPRPECIWRIHQEADVPIITLANTANDALGIEVLQVGAEDHLVKEKLDAQMLSRAIQYAIARHRRRGELRTLCFIDELTGLYNRRAFISIGEQQLKMSRREKTGITVGIADLDGLKRINDQFGHAQGDRALRDIAKVMKATFRDSDVLARIGGDEFGLLRPGHDILSATTAVRRLKKNIDAYLVSDQRPYKLSLSIGVTHYDAGFTDPLTDMLLESDRRMYEEKRQRYSNHSFG